MGLIYKADKNYVIYNKIRCSVFLFIFCCCSCNINNKEKKDLTSFQIKNNEVFSNLINKPVDAKELELEPREYINWLKSNKGLTYDYFENDSLSLAIIYQPPSIQAAMGLTASGMTYEELLKTKEHFHCFMVEFLYKKKIAQLNSGNSNEYLARLKNNLYVIKDQKDTLTNFNVEIFKSPIIGKPDQLFVLVPESKLKESISFSLDKKAFNVSEIKIQIPLKQFDLFPKLKI